MTPIPASATAAPISRRVPGRSPRKAIARPIVKTACNWSTSDASPAGRPRFIAMNSSANCPALSVSPIATTVRAPMRGGRTNSTAGKATSVNRSAANSSGGQESSPTWMTTKFTPQTTATATASRTWRIGMSGRMAVAIHQIDSRVWPVPVSFAA